MKNSTFQFLLVVLIIFISLGFTSCAAAEPIAPYDYTQLLLSVRDLFTVSSMILSKMEPPMIGQAIARIYYGYYHIARLIFNNIKGYDGDNHTETWKAMPNTIKNFGKEMKEMRIKYDYNPYNTTIEEMKKDLQYIYNQRTMFETMVKELENTVVQYSTNPIFKNTFDTNVKEIQDTYSSLIIIINEKLKQS